MHAPKWNCEVKEGIQAVAWKGFPQRGASSRESPTCVAAWGMCKHLTRNECMVPTEVRLQPVPLPLVLRECRQGNNRRVLTFRQFKLAQGF